MKDEKFELSQKTIIQIMAGVIAVLVVIIILLSVALVMVASRGNGKDSQTEEPTEQMSEESGIKEPVITTIIAEGMLRPYKSTTVEALYAPDGTVVTECYAYEGDWVEEDEVLYELSNGWEVKAPMAGKVLAKNYDKGDIVGEKGRELMVIGYTTKMRCTVNIAEYDRDGVYPGLPVKVMTEAFPDRVFAGEIETVSEREILLENGIYYAAEVVVDNPGELFGGLGAEVSFEKEIDY